MSKLLKEIKIENLKQLPSAAQEFVEFVSASPDIRSSIFAFYGKMGVGKTTFIKAMCEVLGVKENVNSPTFTIINEYRTTRGFPIYHFDFYRINKIEEAHDIGVAEYFSSNGVCLIEWPEKIEALLPKEVVTVEITVEEDLSRSLRIYSK